MTDLKRAIPKPPAELILTTPEHLIAFGFGAGLVPKAPGTFGTLVGLPFWFFLQFSTPEYYLVACGLLFVFGCWVCGESARLLGVHDYGGIVFDEIVGFLIACAPLLPALNLTQDSTWLWLFAVFALFRFFDILKPWPIRWLDKHVRGGFGIMLDDVLAGIYSAICLLAAVRIIV